MVEVDAPVGALLALVGKAVVTLLCGRDAEVVEAPQEQLVRALVALDRGVVDPVAETHAHLDPLGHQPSRTRSVRATTVQGPGPTLPQRPSACQRVQPSSPAAAAW